MYFTNSSIKKKKKLRLIQNFRQDDLDNVLPIQFNSGSVSKVMTFLTDGETNPKIDSIMMIWHIDNVYYSMLGEMIVDKCQVANWLQYTAGSKSLQVVIMPFYAHCIFPRILNIHIKILLKSIKHSNMVQKTVLIFFVSLGAHSNEKMGTTVQGSSSKKSKIHMKRVLSISQSNTVCIISSGQKKKKKRGKKI